MVFNWSGVRAKWVRTTELSVSAALVMMQTSAILYADFMNVIILGMHERLGYTLQIAGGISSINLGCTAFGALAGALLSRWLTSVKWCLGYLLAIALFDAVSMFGMSWQPFALLRGLHGLACGGLLACSGAALSHRSGPERIMGASLAIQLALASIGTKFFPALIQEHGLGLVFLVMGLTELATVILLFNSFSYFSANIGKRGEADGAIPALPSSARALCAASLVALFLFQFSRFMVVGYGFQIGDFFGLRRPFIGSVIGASYWLAGLGALVATVLPRRLGRLPPLLFAGVGTLTSVFVLVVWGRSPAVFAITTGAAALLTFVALPYHYGVCFAIDESRALGVWTGFISKFGLALGPASGAFLLSQQALPTVLEISAILVFTATLIACWPARRIDSHLEEV